MTEEPKTPLPQEFLDKLNAVKNKRARVVIEHILQYGSISTQDLKDLYGYNHPPRAAKDVRDEGIPLETFTIKGVDGRSIAAYRFGTPATIIGGREGGRRNFQKDLSVLSTNEIMAAAQFVMADLSCANFKLIIACHTRLVET
jgi:hypothetical protein